MRHPIRTFNVNYMNIIVWFWFYIIMNGENIKFHLRYYSQLWRTDSMHTPLWKKGKDTIKQPVYVSDVATAVMAAIKDPDTRGKIYQAVGWVNIQNNYSIKTKLIWTVNEILIASDFCRKRFIVDNWISCHFYFIHNCLYFYVVVTAFGEKAALTSFTVYLLMLIFWRESLNEGLCGM